MPQTPPPVAIVMGSDSDWPTVQKCAEQLGRFGIGYEAHVISAHRSPVAAHQFAASARGRGVKVLIAAAGLSAALPGVLAAATTLPVIGLPMPGGALDGLDALLSVVQMPPGVPVAAVGLGSAGARNAAILAVQMLGLSDPELAGQLDAFKREMADEVAARSKALQDRIAGGRE